jgi:hypothetical protein
MRAPVRRRARLIGKWPLGIALTSWRYMWRLTPLHRRESLGDRHRDWSPELPPWLDRSDVQDVDAGVGPLFHRLYRADLRGAEMSPERLIAEITADLNRVAPSEFVSFDRIRGEGKMSRNDEYVVRMPAPWDGPVRVVDATPTSFSFITLAGHLEAGQIEFRAQRHDGMLRFSIESWARNGDALAELLYAHLRMAKEVQLHMWTSLLEQVAHVAGGRLTGGVTIETRRLDVA